MTVDTELRGILLENESLAAYTSWRVGGPAKQFYKPADVEDLAQFLKSLPEDEPILWLGLGSNTLIRDKGFSGTVIFTLGCLGNISQTEEYTLRAEAGVSCASLARYAARKNLQDIEFLAGVPGTIGGALRMNAGCFGGETWNHIIEVETLDRFGNIHLRTVDDFQVAYRSVTSPAEEWFIAGHFRLARGEKEASLSKIRELLDRRASTQPTGDPSCGSVFRNPPGDYSARLIEACGLKGKTIGGAQVSPKHANFIINNGFATATDIEQLINFVAQEVERVHGIQLVREAHIIGD